MKKQDSLKPLSSVLGQVDFLSLMKKWPNFVGKSCAKHTIPLGIKNKTLYILSNHSAFSTTLSFMEEKIKQNIFQEFPEFKKAIKKISFKVDSAYFNQETLKKSKILSSVKKENIQEKLHPFSPEYKRLKKEADNLFQNIEDEQLLQSLTSIYMQSKKGELK